MDRWINNGRKNIPTISKLETFISQWQKWWIGLQPTARLGKGKKLQQVEIADEEWGNLSKGGPNGFFNIVASLGWWASSANSAPQLKKCQEMIADVAWVLEQMIQVMTKEQETNRTKDLEQETGKGKGRQ
jgi:hypothetical protein